MRLIRLVPLALAACAAVLTAPVSASACSAAMPARAEKSAVPHAGIDKALLDAAFRAEVNRRRCARGLAELAPARPMVREAGGHSTWMARAGTLSHVSSIVGRAKLMQRLAASGMRFRKGSENIGMVPRFQIDGGRFQIGRGGACQFSRGGQALGPHSYASLARHAVDLWMGSPGHRRNILDPGVHQVATAVAFQNDGHCGRFWLTQNFVG